MELKKLQYTTMELKQLHNINSHFYQVKGGEQVKTTYKIKKGENIQNKIQCLFMNIYIICMELKNDSIQGYNNYII